MKERMQSVYGVSEILKHHDQQQHYQDQHQYNCCPSSLLIPLSSNNYNNVNNIPMTQQFFEDQSYLSSLQHTTIYHPQPQHYCYPYSQQQHHLVDESLDHHSSLSMLQCRWQAQDEDNPTIPTGESLWKPLSTTNDGISNTSHSHSKLLSYSKEDQVQGCCNTSSQELLAAIHHHHHGGSKISKENVNKYRLFGELEEAICSPAVGMNVGEERTYDQTGSGSALTGENSGAQENHCFAVFDEAAAVTSVGVEEVDHHRSPETQLAALRNLKVLKKNKRRKKKKSRTTSNHSSSISPFLERLVKQVMEHQQGLHMKFLEALENMDRVRVQREQEWRCEQMERFQREETARAHERALASSRDAAIVTYLERITNKTINQFHQTPNAINKNIIEERKENP